MRSAPLLALALFATPLLAEQKPTTDRRTIAVTGRGEVKTAPDRARLSFAVETTAAKAAEASAENARRSAAVAAALKALLDAADTIGTAGYGVEPRYERPKPGAGDEPRITGYVVRNEVAVDTRKVDKVGALIDAAAAAGANRVGGLEFSHSRRGELLRGALEQAATDARAQAESVAKGLGVRLKGVLTATTAGLPPEPRQYRAMAMEAAAATPIEPGELALTTTLQVTYELE